MEEYFSREEKPLRVKIFENLQVLTEILSSIKLNCYRNQVSICEWNGQLRRFKRWAEKVVTRESDIDSIDYRLRGFPGLVGQLREAIYELHLRLNDVQNYLLTDYYRVVGRVYIRTPGDATTPTTTEETRLTDERDGERQASMARTPQPRLSHNRGQSRIVRSITRPRL